MTNLPGKIAHSLGTPLDLRAWMEASIKQANDELGWANVRLTAVASIERWWEVTLCAYLWLSLRALVIVLRAADAAPHRWGSAPPADAAASPME